MKKLLKSNGKPTISGNDKMLYADKNISAKGGHDSYVTDKVTHEYEVNGFLADENNYWTPALGHGEWCHFTFSGSQKSSNSEKIVTNEEFSVYVCDENSKNGVYKWHEIEIPYSIPEKKGIARVLYFNENKEDGNKYKLVEINSEINEKLLNESWYPIAIQVSDETEYSDGQIRFISTTNLKNPTFEHINEVNDNLYGFVNDLCYGLYGYSANTTLRIDCPYSDGDEKSKSCVISVNLEYKDGGTRTLKLLNVNKFLNIEEGGNVVKSGLTTSGYTKTKTIYSLNSSLGTHNLNVNSADYYDYYNTRIEQIKNGLKDEMLAKNISLDSSVFYLNSNSKTIHKTYSPMANVCFEYNTLGTNKQDWYIPSFLELYNAYTDGFENVNNASNELTKNLIKLYATKIGDNEYEWRSIPYEGGYEKKSLLIFDNFCVEVNGNYPKTLRQFAFICDDYYYYHEHMNDNGELTKLYRTKLQASPETANTITYNGLEYHRINTPDTNNIPIYHFNDFITKYVHIDTTEEVTDNNGNTYRREKTKKGDIRDNYSPEAIVYNLANNACEYTIYGNGGRAAKWANGCWCVMKYNYKDYKSIVVKDNEQKIIFESKGDKIITGDVNDLVFGYIDTRKSGNVFRPFIKGVYTENDSISHTGNFIVNKAN